MSKTAYTIKGSDFYINGKKTYAEIAGSDPSIQGLLFNARFIQGVFDDVNPANKGKYDRFGKKFNAERHTDDLIAALGGWYKAGLRAITVGMQGGGPIYTYDDWSVIDTNAFSTDGKTLNKAVAARMERLIKACDEIGMLVIVSFLYQAQAHLLKDGVALMNAVRTGSEWLRKLGYANVIIEVANEHDVGDFKTHPLFYSGEGMACLVNLAREWSGGLFAVGSSGGGGSIKREIAENSDVVLVHGNNLRRQELYDFILRVRELSGEKPIVCNECSQLFGNLSPSAAAHASWGYYNNMTKQEPPADWGITPGEDAFFAKRLTRLIMGAEDGENEYYLQGFEKDSHIDGRRYIKLASLYPEKSNALNFMKTGNSCTHLMTNRLCFFR